MNDNKPLKLKLLEPIDGYEDIVEYRIVEKGETAIEGSPYAPSSVVSDWNAGIQKRLVLTKKKSRAEKVGLKVGSCYTRPCVGDTQIFLVISDQNWLYGGILEEQLLTPPIEESISLHWNLEYTEIPRTSKEAVAAFGTDHLCFFELIQVKKRTALEAELQSLKEAVVDVEQHLKDLG